MVKVMRKLVGFYRWSDNLGSNMQIVAWLAASDLARQEGDYRTARMFMEHAVHALGFLIRSGETVVTSIRWTEAA